MSDKEHAAALAELFVGVVGAGAISITVAVAGFVILALIRAMKETDDG